LDFTAYTINNLKQRKYTAFCLYSWLEHKLANIADGWTGVLGINFAT